MRVQISHLGLVVSTVVWFFPVIGAVELPVVVTWCTPVLQGLKPEGAAASRGEFLQRPSPAQREASTTHQPIYRVVFQGVRWLKLSRLAGVIAPWLRRELDSKELQGMTAAVQRFYVGQGFPEASVHIVEPALHENVVTLRIVEGRYAPVRSPFVDP